MAAKKDNDPTQRKRPEVTNVLLSETDLLHEYRHIARDLNKSTDLAQIEATLYRINTQSEETQIAFLKLLRSEKNQAAADVASAIYLLSEKKQVRAEARRVLVQLEAADIYSEWQPPVIPSLSESMPQLLEESQEEGGENVLLSELQSLLTGSTSLTSDSEYLEVVEEFLETWAEGDYEEAYEFLSPDSRFIAGADQEAWAKQRQQWASLAHPENLKITFIDPVAEDSATDHPVIEAGWSIELTGDNASTPSITELPETITQLSETGRHWYWVRYTLVQQDEDWSIQDMVDLYQQVNTLPTDELKSEIEKITARIKENMDEMEEETDDVIENEEQEITNLLQSNIIESEKNEDEDEDEEDEDDDDDEDEEIIDRELLDIFERFSSLTRLATQAMHHTDVLIARTQPEDDTLYQQAIEQALTIGEVERAAVYGQQLLKNSPTNRGEPLRNLALIYMTLSARYAEEENEDRVKQFTALSEELLREGIQADKTDAKTAIILANVLVQQDKEIDYARSLLTSAKEYAEEEDDRFSIEMGLAAIAITNQDLENALTHFQEAGKIDPENDEIWFNIGYHQSQLGKTTEALESFQKSIKISPELTEAYTEMAGIYVEQQKLNQARDILRQGLEINSDAVDLLSTLALVYLSGGDLRSAEKYLEQAEAIDEDDELVQEARLIINAQKKQHRSHNKYTSSNNTKKNTNKKKKR